MSAKRFRVAFSFAGEKREFVEKVARILADRFGEEAAILYDQFHEAEFANPDLAFDLPELYRSNSDLIVAVFCRDYDTKEWCCLEWRAIFSLINKGHGKMILLSRFDHADGRGLSDLGGFIELDHKTSEQFATLILQRLALNEGHPKDHYTRANQPGARAPRNPNFTEPGQRLAEMRTRCDRANRRRSRRRSRGSAAWGRRSSRWNTHIGTRAITPSSGGCARSSRRRWRPNTRRSRRGSAWRKWMA